VPLCPPQTPHAARTRTRAAAVGSQRLTAELRHGQKNTHLELLIETCILNVFFSIKMILFMRLWNYLFIGACVSLQIIKFVIFVSGCHFHVVQDRNRQL
jgi:hypothetical protein